MRAFMPRGNIESLELSFLTLVDHTMRFDLSKLANLPTVAVLSMYPVGMSSYCKADALTSDVFRSAFRTVRASV